MKQISAERLAEIAAIPDERIDTSEIPEVDKTFFRDARIVFPDSEEMLARVRSNDWMNKIEGRCAVALVSLVLFGIALWLASLAYEIVRYGLFG